jgi:hypothetical protein
MKLLSFDIESNGLHGEAFAVGAVLMASDSTIEAEFVGRCPIKGAVDPWVTENVLPPMTNIDENYPDPRAMRDAFWKWYLQTKPLADYVLVNNPYPVEARFLLACQEDDPAGRYADHPFPLIDLASVLLAIGVKTRADREVFIRAATSEAEDLSHNPKWDAWVTARAALKALKA